MPLHWENWIKLLPFIFFVKGDSGSKTMPEFLTETAGRMVLPLEFKDVLISKLPAVSHLNFTFICAEILCCYFVFLQFSQIS